MAGARDRRGATTTMPASVRMRKSLVAGEHGSCGRIHEQGVPMNHGKPLVASSCRISDPMFLYVPASGQSLG